MLGVIKLVRDSLINRCGNRMSGGVSGIAAVNGDGFVFHYLPAVKKKSAILPECRGTPKTGNHAFHTNIELANAFHRFHQAR